MEQLSLPFTELCAGCNKLIKHQPEYIGPFPAGIGSLPMCKECFEIYNSGDDSDIYWEIFNRAMDKLKENFRLSLNND